LQVYAVFDDLMTSMGLASGAQVLFGGCSAGARGALVHLDNIAAWMNTYGIEVRGLLDSGLWIDFQPLTNTGMGGTLVNQAEYVYGFANVSSVIPEDCAQAFPGEEWKCIFPQYRMPFVKTSYFLSASSFDDFQTNYGAPYGGAHRACGSQSDWLLPTLSSVRLRRKPHPGYAD
jgi:hypothetical protein